MIGMVRYYRVTLALPLVVSVFSYFVGRPGGGFLPSLTEIVWFSMLLGGLPYLFLAAFMFFWIGGKSERSIHHVIYMSPFFMVVLLGIAVAVFFPVLRGSSAASRSLADAIARHSILTLVLGYLYVAAVQLTYLGLKATHKISDK